VTGFPLDWGRVVQEALRRRKEEGLTQRSLAALAGVSLPTVNAFERGEINLRFERIAAILSALGLFVQPERSDSLQSFVHDARLRWQSLVDDLPEGSPSRLPDGYSEQAYALDGIGSVSLLSWLRKTLADAPRTSGWPSFWTPTKEAIRPIIRGGVVEAWLGRPHDGRLFTDPSHSDFWQVSREGSAYLRRGYQEDGSDFEAATIFDLTLPIWRTGEVLLHAAWLARTLGGDGSVGIRFVGRYTGLAGRELFSWAKPLLRLGPSERHRARTDHVDLAATTTPDEVEHSLPTVVERVLRPLYERFDGYDPPPNLFAGQVADLLRHVEQHRAT